MNRFAWSSLAVALAMLAGCSHKDRYLNARNVNAKDIGTIAAYVPLLTPTDFPDVDPKHEVVEAVQRRARQQICDHAAGASGPLHTGSGHAFDVSHRVGAILGGMKEACCSDLPLFNVDIVKTNQVAQSCKSAANTADSALAAIDAEAVAAGLPAHTIPRFDATSIDATTRAQIAAIHAAADPTPAETNLNAVWKDPNATPDALKAACDAAVASNGSPDTRPRVTVSERIADSRAQVTNDRCNELSIHLTRLDNEKRCEHIESLHAKCPRDRFCDFVPRYDVPPGLVPLLAAPMQRCK